MAKEKKTEELKVVVVEYKVYMHCNGCERTVARTISKIKGVEKFTTEMNKHKVVVTGKIDPQKVLKKLMKKTGKRVEIVVNNKKEEVPKDASNVVPKPVLDPLIFGWFSEDQIFMMFSDENPNACSIM